MSGLVAERHAVVLGVAGLAFEGHLESHLRLVVSRQPVQVVEAEPERVAGTEAALIFGTVAVEIDVFVASLLQDRPAAAVRLEVAPEIEWGRRVKAPTPVEVGAVDRTAWWRHRKGAHATRQQTPRTAECGGDHLDDTVDQSSLLAHNYIVNIMTSSRSSR